MLLSLECRGVQQLGELKRKLSGRELARKLSPAALCRLEVKDQSVLPPSRPCSNRIFTEGTCKLLTLVISDLVDEDTVLNERPHPLSALIYGSAALVAKPGQTLAPLLGTLLLSFHTGREIFRPHAAGSPRSSDFNLAEVSDSLRATCFYMLTLVSASCAVLQLLAWCQYSLRDQRLLWIKRLREEGSSMLRTLHAVV